MKYAVIKISGKQYKVSVGDILRVDKLDIKPKVKLGFKEVLLIIDNKKVTIGKPFIKNASVTAEVIEQFKDKKVRVAKFKAKSRYRKVQGHRQFKTKIKITKIIV